MKKIETLEELRAERERLNGVARQMENKLQGDFSYFSNHIQSFFSIFSNSNPLKITSQLLLKSALTTIPFLLSKRKAKSKATPPSPWAALGTTALSLLASGQIGDLLGKATDLLSSFGKKKEKEEA